MWETLQVVLHPSKSKHIVDVIILQIFVCVPFGPASSFNNLFFIITLSVIHNAILHGCSFNFQLLYQCSSVMMGRTKVRVCAKFVARSRLSLDEAD